MAYTPDWEPLADALKRVIAGDASEDEAKLDISRALADRKIRTQLTVEIEPDAFMNWHRMADNARGLGSRAMWEHLANVLARLVATGIDEAQAKRNICCAIADRRVSIRFRVAGEEGIDSVGTVRSGAEIEIPADLKPRDLDWHGSHLLKHWRNAPQGKNAYIEIVWSDQSIECFQGANVNVPTHLQPSDFYWENSRPRKPWPIKMRGARLSEWRLFSRPALLIELLVSDINKVLCGTKSSVVGQKRGRPPEYNWASVKSRLAEYTQQNGHVQSMNELLEICSDFARKLHPRKKTPDDKTIREAIKKHGLDLAASFVPGKSPGK